MTLALPPLDIDLDYPMARSAQRNQVLKSVGGAVVGEQTVRSDVVDIAAREIAPLACMPVALSGRAFLSSPVRASLVVRSAQKLGVQLSDPVCVPTHPRAELPHPSVNLRPARWGKRKCRPASSAREVRAWPWSACDRLILTCRRAMNAAPMLIPGRNDRELTAALRARLNDLLFRAWLPLLTSCAFAATCIRTKYSRLRAVLLNEECLGTNSASLCNHYRHMVGRA